MIDTYLIVLVFSVYAVTLIIVESDILYPMRSKIISKTPALRIRELHFLECRMCVGFWVSLFLSIFLIQYESFLEFLFVALFAYGASYFLATQER